MAQIKQETNKNQMWKLAWLATKAAKLSFLNVSGISVAPPEAVKFIN
jgi:hypothetical protein